MDFSYHALKEVTENRIQRLVVCCQFPIKAHHLLRQFQTRHRDVHTVKVFLARVFNDFFPGIKIDKNNFFGSKKCQSSVMDFTTGESSSSLDVISVS